MVCVKCEVLLAEVFQVFWHDEHQFDWINTFIIENDPIE